MRPLILPKPPQTYDPEYMNRMMNAITLWAAQFNKPLELSVRFADVGELPTVSSLATIPSGSMYVDTSASNVVKRKP